MTDIVVSATVTALLLALVVQIAKRHGTVVPDELHALRGVDDREVERLPVVRTVRRPVEAALRLLFCAAFRAAAFG